MAKAKAKKSQGGAKSTARRSKRKVAAKPKARARPRVSKPARRDAGAPLPSYAALPVRAGAPPGAAWGVFGDDDEVGTINLLTPERVREAARLVRSGKVFALNLPINVPDPPLFTRGRHQHHIKQFAEFDFVLDDYLDNFYPQASSQWDALCHVKHPLLGAYNGIPDREITGRGGTRLGIDNLARRGIAGRGVLADLARYHERHGKSIDHARSEIIPLEDLEATLAEQRVKLTPGTILLIRTGWLQFYLSASAHLKEELARETTVPGIEGTARTARFFWDHHLAAVAADSPALENLPKAADEQDLLHFHLLALFGMPIGEMWNLEALAADCVTDKRYEFFLTSAPLNIPGGVGSPPNALAIK